MLCYLLKMSVILQNHNLHLTTLFSWPFLYPKSKHTRHITHTQDPESESCALHAHISPPTICLWLLQCNTRTYCGTKGIGATVAGEHIPGCNHFPSKMCLVKAYKQNSQETGLHVEIGGEEEKWKKKRSRSKVAQLQTTRVCAFPQH